MRLVFNFALIGALTALTCVVPVFADELAEQGRSILDAHKNAVVTVKIVVRLSGQGNSQEAPQEVSGTVIGADGLTVVSLNRADPSTMLRQLYGDQEGFDISSEIKDVKILMEDNSEVDAEVVLRDKDLDLAFIRPLEKPEAEFAFVSLDLAPEVKIFDPVIILNRLGTVARRTYAVSLDRIDAIVEKPRKFYLPSSAQNRSELGSPVFTAGGDFIGIGVIRAIQAEQSFFGGGENFTVIIVPASDIKESAIQVPPFGEKAPEDSAGEAPAEEAPAEG